jgi:hypothetical protein
MTKTKMITAAAALDALVAAGFIPSYKRSKEDEHGYNVTLFQAKSDKLNYISNETYGKKSFLYFYCYGSREARELIDIIRKAGGNPGTDWNGGPNKGNVELRVRYFKGRRWWE